MAPRTPIDWTNSSELLECLLTDGNPSADATLESFDRNHPQTTRGELHVEVAKFANVLRGRVLSIRRFTMPFANVASSWASSMRTPARR